jgi:lipopolysaccharide export system protein LptA
MRPGGTEIDVARTLTPGRLDFLPTVPGGRTRQLDSGLMTVHYGAQNVIQDFRATLGATTRTVTPAAPLPGGKPAPPVVTITRSKELEAHFDAHGQVTIIDQRGNFEYEQETRRARAATAQLDEVNSITTLRGQARSWDEGGSVAADEIRIEQKTGFTTAQGHVNTVRLPDKKDPAPGAKPSSPAAAPAPAPANDGLISNSEPVLGRARTMTSWDHHTKTRYTGDAELWQGETRVTAREILLDRTTQTLEAHGNVVTRVPDKRANDTAANPVSSAASGTAAASAKPASANSSNSSSGSAAKPASASAARTFSVVYAPEFTYNDKTKQGFYREHARLERKDLTLNSRYLRVFFEDVPKIDGGTETQLEHMEADGAVDLLQHPPGHVRTGHAEHMEYYPSEERVLLTGGAPEVTDPDHGTTRGPRINWFSHQDRIVVEGAAAGPRVQSRSVKGHKP